jgi:hypothetical protein
VKYKEQTMPGAHVITDIKDKQTVKCELKYNLDGGIISMRSKQYVY